MRAKTEIETLRGDRQQINVTEIPYEVNKAQLVKRINDLRLAKKLRESRKLAMKLIVVDYELQSN